MNPTKKEAGAATPPTSRYDEKRKINTKVNGVINFQIGLIAVLIAAYAIVEFAVPIKEAYVPKTKTFTFDDPDWNPRKYTIVRNKPLAVVKETPKVVVKPAKPIVNLLPPVIDNNATDSDHTDNQIDQNNSVDAEPEQAGKSSGTLNPEPVAPINSHVNIVMEVPLFPGCSPSLNREERIKCLNSKMARFVQKHFDTHLATTLGSKKAVKIGVQFTIDFTGNPVDIIVKAPNKELELEALRVIKKLPTMTPGKNNGAAVNVTYSLPINFMVGD
jgi:protein TonB